MPEIKLTKLSLVSHRSKNGLTNLNQTKHVAAKKKKKNTDSPLDQESHLCQPHQQGPVEEHHKYVCLTLKTIQE